MSAVIEKAPASVPEIPARVSDPALIIKRRRSIVRAATKLMLRQGYHETSVREIAGVADLTMGGLYSYISRKEDVLYLITETIMEELYGSLKTLKPMQTALETLRAAVQHYFAAVHRMRGEIRLMYRESASLLPEHLDATKRTELEGREFFAAIIEDGMSRGEFRTVSTDIVAHDIITLGHMWSLKAWAFRDKCDHVTYYETQFEMLAHFLRPDPVPAT